MRCVTPRPKINANNVLVSIGIGLRRKPSQKKKYMFEACSEAGVPVCLRPLPVHRVRGIPTAYFAMLPGGWIAAETTAEAAVALAGAYLTLGCAAEHLAIAAVEDALRVPARARFPGFRQVLPCFELCKVLVCGRSCSLEVWQWLCFALGSSPLYLQFGHWMTPPTCPFCMPEDCFLTLARYACLRDCLLKTCTTGQHVPLRCAKAMLLLAASCAPPPASS